MNRMRVEISVRGLVGFALQSGNLASGFINPGRGAEGTRAHQKVQQMRPDGYQTEVAVTHVENHGDFAVEVSGRIDGLIAVGDTYRVEEIKTTRRAVDEEHTLAPQHWAQAQVYAYIVAVQKEVEEVDIQLTYVNLDTWQTAQQHRSYDRDELAEIFHGLLRKYLRWVGAYREWCQERDRSIAQLPLPFPSLRKGQRELMLATYQAVDDQGRLFAQAPTGIGKTISVLFPAIKGVGQGKVEKVFYLTAKTSGRAAAEKALDEMRRVGLAAKSIRLTARDKICFVPTGQASCDPEHCEFAVGYFDRIGGAIEELFQLDAFTPAVIEDAARRHTVCPFELSLDLALWSDVIICDYNHLFDPRAYLKRFFLEGSGSYLFLIDEAHNLLDRARDIFSAQLTKKGFRTLERTLHDRDPRLATKLADIDVLFVELEKRCVGEESGFVVDSEPPKKLLPLLQSFLDTAEPGLSRAPASYRDLLFDRYFETLAFMRVAELYNEQYVTYAEKRGRDLCLRLFCRDPSKRIAEALTRGKVAVFFSATLTPLEYFRQVLGGDTGDRLLDLESPFPAEHLEVLLADGIETTYSKRATTYGQVMEAIAAVTDQTLGNYMIYFPSFKYMDAVVERFAAAHPATRIEVQRPYMSEAERAAFLNLFNETGLNTLVGFAVMGGIFGEGIDLVGERLVGAVIVGVGLPQICLERDLVRLYYDDGERPGFEFAYTYPGMNRVLQAVGRVIRSADDRGIVLLIDRRFNQARYQRLFPSHWRGTKRVCDTEQIKTLVDDFWQR
jgi:DNA excision repair protein ERCC-2